MKINFATMQRACLIVQYELISNHDKRNNEETMKNVRN